MAVKTIADLLVEANLIKNATIAGENTATRVGGNLVNIIDSFSVNSAPIPQPIVGYDNSTNEMFVHFHDTGFDFTQYNPEIFLFRYKNKRRGKNPINGSFRIRYPGYVHPITVNANTKWAGWKFFSGQQQNRLGAFVNTRITEWTIPPTIKPYEKFTLTGFNKYMYWNEINNSIPAITKEDVNVFGSLSYFTYDRNLILPTTINLSGSNRGLGKADLYAKTTNYCFAVAIDNPLATKTNGLCPKIFGPYSEPIFAILKMDLGTNDVPADVVMVVQNNNTWFRAARPQNP